MCREYYRSHTVVEVLGAQCFLSQGWRPGKMNGSGVPSYGRGTLLLEDDKVSDDCNMPHTQWNDVRSFQEEPRLVVDRRPHNLLTSRDLVSASVH